MDIREVFDVIDMHAAGEPLRIILSGYPRVLGRTVLEKRQYLQEHLDHLRRKLMWEPWGHEDMYGCLLVEPERPDSLYGLIFMHNEGYSTMCGHATIAVTKMVVETGRVPVPADGEKVTVRFDVPSGQVEAHAHMRDGRVHHVEFENVPAFPVALDIEVAVDEQPICLDVSFGGAYYAIVDSASLGLAVTPENVDAFRAWAAKIKPAVEELHLTQHPEDPRLNSLYGVIFTDAPEASSHHSRNITVFADGQVDRSPCGSCLSSRLAALDAKKEIERHQPVEVESVIGTSFTGQVIGDGPQVGDFSTVRTTVAGQASWLGFRRFFSNPHDPVEPFLVR
ncbi:proline racemase family protein [Alicyclobacillus sp. ALC3]|uniref:proline racemase family protein n=1 Tax=Alicyclobacillus sp. ALC3 TaxID=2796143 RepID=UPI002379717E|nr:proline racemase family protein [Alicyclobacillus sp. ALC3]WDL97643.1 proline racemase family protein [Alicyclobacillus sp. ALC3]